MTERLYYTDSFLYEFDAHVLEILPASQAEARPAVILDRTAFYPTSGGQVFDTGSIVSREGGAQIQPKVIEVAERDDGAVLHFLDEATPLRAGLEIHGTIDTARRRDHMQQHSGQHVLSAAFIRLFNMPTVSFHMGDDYCSIDLETKSANPHQLAEAEKLANEIILEDRPVDIHFVTQQEAQGLGLRKLPPIDKGELRLIDIRDFDLTACGGTHVGRTGQIGCILLRKTEKVRQGIRVEFVCGQRAVRTARQDYIALAEAAGLLSSHIWDVPQQIRKSQEEAKAPRRQREKLLEELAEQQAFHMLAETPEQNGRKLIVEVFPDRDLPYIKLLAQKLTRSKSGVIALLGTTMGSPSVVTASSAGESCDLGALLKEALTTYGGRGGGSKDMAQGGVPEPESAQKLLSELAGRLGGARPQARG